MGFLDKITGKDVDEAKEKSEEKDGGFFDSIKDAIVGEDEVPQAPVDEPTNDAGKATPRGGETSRAERRESKPEKPKAEKPKPKPKKEAPKHRTYTVKSGDTLSEIGQEFGVSYMDIARLNNIENPDLIYPGQVFKIPNK